MSVLEVLHGILGEHRHQPPKAAETGPTCLLEQQRGRSYKT